LFYVSNHNTGVRREVADQAKYQDGERWGPKREAIQSQNGEIDAQYSETNPTVRESIDNKRRTRGVRVWNVRIRSR